MAIFDQAPKTRRFGFHFAPLLLGLALGAPATIVRAEATDPDLDGVQQDVDNCPFHVNPPQRDTDNDGHGNRCDPDLDNNGVVGISDFVIASAAYGSNESDPRWNPHADIDGDGVVGGFDAAFVQDHFASKMPLGADIAHVGLVARIRWAFASKRGDEGYDPGADLTGDGVIGTPDFVVASRPRTACAAPWAGTGPVPSGPVPSGLADHSGDGVVGIPDFVIESQPAVDDGPVTSGLPELPGLPDHSGDVVVGIPDLVTESQQAVAGGDVTSGPTEPPDQSGDGIVCIPDFGIELQQAVAGGSVTLDLADLPDHSGDGVVGIPDFVIEYQKATGELVTSAALPCDLTGDGVIGIRDFVLQSQR